MREDEEEEDEEGEEGETEEKDIEVNIVRTSIYLCTPSHTLYTSQEANTCDDIHYVDVSYRISPMYIVWYPGYHTCF